MSNEKIKLYKNPLRNEKEKVAKYIPQYKELGLEPKEVRSSLGQSFNQNNYKSTEKSKKIDNTLPYADVETFPSIKENVPNIGNSMEHTWSGVDGQIINDLDQEFPTSPDHPMIDNNEFISPEAFNLPPQNNEENNLSHILYDLKVNSYLLLVHGAAICSGPLSEIEDQVRALIFGEHELCEGNPVSEDAIVVVKRAHIKVGVFLE